MWDPAEEGDFQRLPAAHRDGFEAMVRCWWTLVRSVVPAPTTSGPGLEPFLQRH